MVPPSRPRPADNATSQVHDAELRSLVRPRSSESLVAAVILLLLVTFSAFMPAQNDTWWNLAAGRHIVDTGSVELRDPFSWTARGRYWSNHEWLSQVLFYLAYAAGGMPGLAVLGTMLVALVLIVLWQASTGPPLLRALVLLLLATSLVAEWSLRPKLFTLAALALTIWLVAERRLLWLPPLFLLWANLHGAVALGIVVLGAACLEALVHDRRRFFRMATVALLCAGATAITPLGFSILDDVVLSLQRSDVAHISEWQPAGHHAWAYPVFVIVPATLALVWYCRRSLTPGERVMLYMAAALLPLALRFARNVPVFMLAAAPLVTSLLNHIEPVRLLFRSGRSRTTPLLAPLAAALTLSVVTIGSAWVMRPARLGWDPLPAEAAAAIGACGQPLYNHFDNGGHLIWFVPEQPVFIDSRVHPYSVPFVLEHFRVEDTGDYEPLFAGWNIRCAVLPPWSPVAVALVRDGWRVEYQDPAWLIATRPETITSPVRSSRPD